MSKFYFFVQTNISFIEKWIDGTWYHAHALIIHLHLSVQIAEINSWTLSNDWNSESWKKTSSGDLTSLLTIPDLI